MRLIVNKKVKRSHQFVMTGSNMLIIIRYDDLFVQ